MFPIKDSVPSRSTPIATRALILVNVVVFFFELGLPHQSVEQLFYLFGLVPARFSHPDWALAVGFPVDSFWPILTHQLRHGSWTHSFIRESRLHRAIGRRIWRYCRSPRCLFSLFPDCASASDVSDLLFFILFRNA